MDLVLMDMDFKLIRSRRTTVGIQVSRDGEVIVRAPYGVSQAQIRRIIDNNSAWIARQKEQLTARAAAHPEPTEEQQKVYIKYAKELIPQRVAYYAPRMGVEPTGITITGARTRFGSCSAKNRLSFSWRLMDYPMEAIDYVVVHELAHIRHHDHSPAFYAFIASVMPDHKERRALLRK